MCLMVLIAAKVGLDVELLGNPNNLGACLFGSVFLAIACGGDFRR